MHGDLQRDVDTVVQAISDRVAPGGRLMVAIAGAPASGKSTLAESVVTALNAPDPDGGFATLLPMDGFHLDNRILDARGLRPRKGAPETFDAAGFYHLLKRVREANGEIFHPVFDRHLDMAIAGAGLISDAARVVVVEGNYLLLDTEPWRLAHGLYDLTVFVKTSMEELERRLLERWRVHGETPENGWARTHDNDLPNARTVMEGSVEAMLRLGDSGSA